MNGETIFAEALKIKCQSDRQAFVKTACAGDERLRAEVESLLQANARAGSFLQCPPIDADATVKIDCPERNDGDSAEKLLPYLTRCDTPGRIGRLGNYEIIEVVGKGGMGVVLRAVDTKLNRIVAIKVLAQELATNKMAVKRFLGEAQKAAAVVHNHVVTIHAVDDSHEVPFLVMEFVEGQTLQQKIDREGALELKAILRISTQIAEGLAAAHKRGMIHHDVKPSNILLENGVERVKIADFGLARAVDDVRATQSGLIVGTPEYMSPEQAQGQQLDCRSDLFSLGSVMYSMCTGRPAFRAGSVVSVLRRLCDETPRPIREVNQEIPDWLVAIIDRLLSKNPNDRFQRADEVGDLLGSFLAHIQTPTQIPLPAGLSRAPKVGNGNMTRWLLAAGASVVLVAVAMGLWARRSSPKPTSATTPAHNIAPASSDRATLRIEPADVRVTLAVGNTRVQTWEGQGEHVFDVVPGTTYLIDVVDAKTENLIRRDRFVATSGDKKRLIVRLPAGRPLPVGDAVPDVELSHQSGIEDIAFSPNGQLLATAQSEWSGAGASITIWKGEGGQWQQDRQLTNVPKIVRGVAFHPNEQVLASIGDDGAIDVWDLTNGNSICSLRTGRPFGEVAVFTPNGVLLAATFVDGCVELFDWKKGSRTAHFQAHDMDTGRHAAAISPDGLSLATGGWDRCARIWDLSTQQKRHELVGHSGKVEAVAFSSNSRVVTAAWDERVRVWDAQSGQLLKCLDSSSIVLAIACSSDGLVAAASTDETVKIWQVEGGSTQPVAHFFAHWAPVRCITFSPDGTKLVTGSWDRTARIWNVSQLRAKPVDDQAPDR